MSVIPELPFVPPDPVQAVRSAPRDPRGATPAGPAFEALLERLTARAAVLEEKSKTFATPADLPEALDAARASLEDALALGTELIEAYRAAGLRAESGEESR